MVIVEKIRGIGERQEADDAERQMLCKDAATRAEYLRCYLERRRLMR